MRVHLESLNTEQPGHRREDVERRVASRLALELGVTLAEARALLGRLPAVLPREVGAERGEALAAALRSLGVAVSLTPGQELPERCARHGRLEGGRSCTGCGRRVCVVCEAAHEGRCPDCGANQRFRLRFRAIRIGILTFALFGVLLYAGVTLQGRQRLTRWERPVSVALVLLAEGPLDPSDVERLKSRVPALGAQLGREFARHRPASGDPFEFLVLGPVPATAPPAPPPADDWLSLLRHGWALEAWAKELDGRAGLNANVDKRIYLQLVPSAGKRRLAVEGSSLRGGPIGVVRAELAKNTVDFALFVAAHELFHTLGADDRYDVSTGAQRLPEALAEPDLRPLYPQQYAELMSRGRCVSPTEHEPIDTLGELLVGPKTATEVGWLRQTDSLSPSAHE